MSQNDSLDLLQQALVRTLDRSESMIGREILPYVPVFRRGVEVLVRFIRERGHHETLRMLDMLAMMPPEKL